MVAALGFTTILPRTAVTPVPLSGTVCGLPAALSVRVRVPVRTPAADGVKVTAISQVIPGLRETGQLLVNE